MSGAVLGRDERRLLKKSAAAIHDVGQRVFAHPDLDPVVKAGLIDALTSAVTALSLAVNIAKNESVLRQCKTMPLR